MEIVVVSDTHRNTTFIKKIIKKHPNAKYFLHAGDSECHEFELDPFLSVKGNCDYYIKNKYRIIDILGVKIYIFHGDHTLLSDDCLVGISKNNNCDIIIHGHTHIPYYSYKDNVHILCPGSITYPRSKRATYAVITIKIDNEAKKEIFVEIKEYEEETSK